MRNINDTHKIESTFVFRFPKKKKIFVVKTETAVLGWRKPKTEPTFKFENRCITSENHH